MVLLSVQFHCPACAARIKAPLALVGQQRACPGCDHSFIVPHPVRPDLGPILVPLESGYGSPGIARRRSA